MRSTLRILFLYCMFTVCIMSSIFPITTFMYQIISCLTF